jgi:exodeoxyribonuclease VII large subunit
MRRQLQHENARFAVLMRRLQLAHPGARLAHYSQRLDELEGRLQFALQAGLAAQTARLEGAARALQGVSPLATLGRGFAVITRSADGALVTVAAQLAVGDAFDATLAQGSLHAVVLTSRS